MCFQGFIYFACGHSDISEAECPLAKTLDIPFYIKVSCPQYRTRSTSPNAKCGIGGYYCKHTHNGQTLDIIHQNQKRAEAELRRIDERITKLQIMEAQFIRSADQARVSAELRKKHPIYAKLAISHQQFLQERNRAYKVQTDCTKMITAAIKLYTSHANVSNQRPTTGDIPPSYANSAIKALQMPGNFKLEPPSASPFEVEGSRSFARQYQGMPGSAVITADTIDVSEDKLQEIGPNLYQHPSAYRSLDGDNVTVTSRRSGAFVLGSNSASMNKTIQQEPTSHPTDQMAKTRGRLSKRTVGQDLNTPHTPGRSSASPKKVKAKRSEESSNVRRSARVRDKKVNYAESDASSIASRAASPAKSDVSGFSPGKSDMSASPVKMNTRSRSGSHAIQRGASSLHDSKLRRGSSSLSNLIGDWERRNGAQGAVAANDSESRLGNNLTDISGQLRGEDTTSSFGLGKSRLGIFHDGQVVEEQTIPTVSTNANAGPPIRHGPPEQSSLHRQDSFTSMSQPAATPNFLPMSHMQGRPSNLYNMYASGVMNTGTPSLLSSIQGGLFNMPPDMSIAPRNWMINTPAFNTQADLAAAPQPASEMPNIVADPDPPAAQVIDFSTANTPEAHPNIIAANTDYEGLRRSLSGAPPDLTPSAATDQTPATTDPKKRKVSASSPLLSSSKRMRLSLAGEDSTGSVYDSDLPYNKGDSMSSPSKMPSQQLPNNIQNDQDPATRPEEQTPPARAPVLAPMAVMYVPSQHDEEETGEGPTDLSEHPNEVEEGIDQFGNPYSSDIDWGFFNDDLVN